MRDTGETNSAGATGWRAFQREVPLVLGATALLALVLVVIPLGLAAASALDRAHPLREALGEIAPLPYRVFVVARTWLFRGAPILAGIVVAHCALRRIVRRSLSFGDDLRWDAFVSPAATTLVAALLGLIAYMATENKGPDASSRGDVTAAAGALAGGLGMVGLALGLAVRSRLVRRLAVALVAVLALLPLARWAADAWGAARLRSFARSLEPQITAERQRMAAARSPVLREPVLDEDASPRYRMLMSQMAAVKYPGLGQAAGAGPGSPVGPDAVRVLAQYREVVRGLREAVHCNRCVWELKPVVPSEPIPSPLHARTLVNLLVVEGHERAQKGDARGAAERYLDAVRFGCDFRHSPLISNLVGIAVAGAGLDALGRLLVSGLRPPLAQIGSELAKLEGHLPTAATVLGQERLDVLGGLTRVEKAEDVFGVPPVLTLLVPYRLLVAQAAEALDPRWRAIESASTVADPKEAERALAAAAEPGPTWNPVFKLVSPTPLPRIRVTVGSLAARFLLAKTAVTIEEAAARTGRYPEASAVALPADPLVAVGTLRYERSPDGKGYRLWSVGANERDDGGTSRDNLDLVLERPARR